MNASAEELLTLDPPGTITVVGAGPLGIEAALYGRYLGYDVTLLEAAEVGASLRSRGDEPLPMLPGRCLSPLAIAALQAQSQSAPGQPASSQPAPSQPAQSKGAAPPPVCPSLPLTFRQWIESAWVPLTESDLLAGRLRMPVRVERIDTVPVAGDDAAGDDAAGDDEAGDDEAGEPIPPDFLLTAASADRGEIRQRSEAVIVATGADDSIELGFAAPIPYFFRLDGGPSEDLEAALLRGRGQIVALYASLAGRSELDLYRPRRGAT